MLRTCAWLAVLVFGFAVLAVERNVITNAATIVVKAIAIQKRVATEVIDANTTAR